MRTWTSSEKQGKVPLYWLSNVSRLECAMSSKCTTTVLPNLQHHTNYCFLDTTPRDVYGDNNRLWKRDGVA